MQQCPRRFWRQESTYESRRCYSSALVCCGRQGGTCGSWRGTAEPEQIPVPPGGGVTKIIREGHGIASAVSWEADQKVMCG
jgi:hypothetical protein